MRAISAILLMLMVVTPAAADMFQDASNAKLPNARQNLGIALKVDDYGGGTGVADNSAAINAACDALAATGGFVDFGPGVYTHVSPITTHCAQNGIILRGAGRSEGESTAPGFTTPFWVTSLKYTGSSIPGAQISFVKSGVKLNGVGVEDMMVDSNGLAGYGIEMISTEFAIISGAGIANQTIAGIHLDANADGEIQQLNMTDLFINEWGASSTTANCVLIGAGTSIHNSNHSNARLVKCRHNNGTGFDIFNADSFVWDQAHAEQKSGGTGVWLKVHGAATDMQVARANTFLSYYPGPGGVQGDCTSTVHPYANHFIDYNPDSGVQNPTNACGISTHYIDGSKSEETPNGTPFCETQRLAGRLNYEVHVTCGFPLGGTPTVAGWTTIWPITYTDMTSGGLHVWAHFTIFDTYAYTGGSAITSGVINRTEWTCALTVGTINCAVDTAAGAVNLLGNAPKFRITSSVSGAVGTINLQLQSWDGTNSISSGQAYIRASLPAEPAAPSLWAF